MTLKNYHLHNQFLTQNNNGIIKTIDVSMYDPDLEAIVEQQEQNDAIREMEPFMADGMTPDEASEAPFSSQDSRKLLENRIHTSLTLDEQAPLREQIITILNESYNETNKDKMDVYNNKRQMAYNIGVRESLAFVLNQIRFNNVCLYRLEEYFREKADRFTRVLIDETDEEEYGYPQSRHKGNASAYINVANLIKEKLALEEANKFKQIEDTNIR